MKMRATKATRLISPAAPKSTYSFSIFCRASGSSTVAILAHRPVRRSRRSSHRLERRGDEGDGGAEREGGRAQRPAGVDIAHVGDVEIDTGETGPGGDRDGQRDPHC